MDPLSKTEEKEILLLVVIVKCMILKVGFTRFGKIGFDVRWGVRKVIKEMQSSICKWNCQVIHADLKLF